MIRWLLFLVLVVALLSSAVGVVAMRHESRHLFARLQAVETERDQANVEWSRLQLEQAWLAESGRIERQAEAELGMLRPERVGILMEQP